IGAHKFSPFRIAISGAAAILCFVGVIAAVRGTVVEHNADITRTARFLDRELGPTTRVFINVDALSIASRLDAKIVVASAEYEPIEGYVNMIERRHIDPRIGDYLVIATVHYEREAGARVFGDTWLPYLTSLEKTGSVRVVFQNQNTIVGRFVR